MEYYLLMDQWAALVRDFKDSEKAYEREPRDSEQLALRLLDFIRYTRIRQWTLFVQRRGEEYEGMIASLVELGFPKDAIFRFVDSDTRWALTLEMAEH